MIHATQEVNREMPILVNVWESTMHSSHRAIVWLTLTHTSLRTCAHTPHPHFSMRATYGILHPCPHQDRGPHLKTWFQTRPGRGRRHHHRRHHDLHRH